MFARFRLFLLPCFALSESEYTIFDSKDTHDREAALNPYAIGDSLETRAEKWAEDLDYSIKLEMLMLIDDLGSIKMSRLG